MHRRWLIRSVAVGGVLTGVVTLALLAPRTPRAMRDENLPKRELLPAEIPLAKPRINARGFMVLPLVHDEKVQRDLGLSAEQSAALRAMVEQFLGEIKVDLQARRKMFAFAEPEKLALAQALNQQREESLRAQSEKTAELLSESQCNRLAEIALQLRMEEGFYETDVIDQLGLDRGQLQQIARERSSLKAEAQTLTERHVRRELSQAELKEALNKLRVQAQARELYPKVVDDLS